MAKRKHNLVMASFEEQNHSTISSEQYFLSLDPKGRFQPTDQELVTHFLKMKISGDPLPMNLIVDELWLYAYSPEQLSHMYGFANQEDMYFFTRIAGIHCIPHRKTGNGFWKPTSQYLEIKEGNEIIGFKKSFRFYVGSRGKDAKLTNWTMLEYTPGDYFAPIGSESFGLCKVFEKKTNAKNVPDLNRPGKAAANVTRDGSYIPRPLQEIYQREKRCCAWSEHSSQLAFPISCTSSFLKPCVPELPLEIIVETLSWLPVECLLRFMCVCKKWCALIQDYKFIAKHMGRVSCVRISVQKKWETHRVAIIHDKNFRLVSYFGGLFLEKSLYTQVFRIRNIASHQVLCLPCEIEVTSFMDYSVNLYHGTTMDFALNLFTGECRVACFYRKADKVLSGCHELGFKVITIGKDEQWRPLKFPNQNDKLERKQCGKYVLNRLCFGPDKVNGVAHLVEIIRDEQDVYLEIQSYDVWSESFTTTTLPRGVFLDLEKVSVIRWNHCVAVADIADGVLNILVLEDSRKHKWSEKQIIPLKFLKDDPVLEGKIIPVKAGHDSLGLYDGVRYIELYELDNYGRLKSYFLYDTRREMFHKVTSPPPCWTKSYTYLKPSLVTLKGMRLKRNTLISCV